MLQLATITAPFYPSLAELGEFEAVAPEDMPETYQSLLAHNDHMTVTVEAYHDTLVDVRVLQEHREGEVYSRASLLACQSTGRVVQLGIMRINLRGLSNAVRQEIESRRLPLGRILIRHNVLRRVELHRLWRISPGPELQRHLDPHVDESLRDSNSGLGEAGPRIYIYGRSAGIVVECRPAVELLEIVKA